MRAARVTKKCACALEDNLLIQPTVYKYNEVVHFILSLSFCVCPCDKKIINYYFWCKNSSFNTVRYNISILRLWLFGKDYANFRLISKNGKHVCNALKYLLFYLINQETINYGLLNVVTVHSKQFLLILCFCIFCPNSIYNSDLAQN